MRYLTDIGQTTRTEHTLYFGLEFMIFLQSIKMAPINQNHCTFFAELFSTRTLLTVRMSAVAYILINIIMKNYVRQS